MGHIVLWQILCLFHIPIGKHEKQQDNFRYPTLRDEESSRFYFCPEVEAAQQWTRHMQLYPDTQINSSWTFVHFVREDVFRQRIMTDSADS